MKVNRRSFLALLGLGPAAAKALPAPSPLHPGEAVIPANVARGLARLAAPPIRAECSLSAVFAQPGTCPSAVIHIGGIHRIHISQHFPGPMNGRILVNGFTRVTITDGTPAEWTPSGFLLQWSRQVPMTLMLDKGDLVHVELDAPPDPEPVHINVNTMDAKLFGDHAEQIADATVRAIG
ncbi:MAG TPA: hypothetical protein VFO27_14595 [Bryobacteraceae bacterium]|nr:hypothetical protein [Bryobacteraceae bacterium]